MKRRSGGVGLGAALVLFAPWLSAQTPAPQVFDVASVKANHSGDEPSSAFTQPGGRCAASEARWTCTWSNASGDRILTD